MKIRVEEYIRPDGSSPYRDWFDGLDAQSAAKVTTAKLRMELGNTSNVKWFAGIGEYVWEITVKALSARRGPASEARLLYEEDPASLARRQEAVARKRERREPRVRGDAVDRAKLRALKRGG